MKKVLSIITSLTFLAGCTSNLSLSKKNVESSPDDSNTFSNIQIADESGEVTLSIAPIPGVASSTSEFVSINDGLSDRAYHPVPWLIKSNNRPSGLKEYVDSALNVRFLYPADRGELRWDARNKEFFIKGNYHLDDKYLPSFQIKFSEVIAMPEVDGSGPTSPSNFCAKRLASYVPLDVVDGCFMRRENNRGVTLMAVVHSWDNDAGYEVEEADAELSDHSKFKSVNIQLQYSDQKTNIDSQTLLYILDSIRAAQ